MTKNTDFVFKKQYFRFYGQVRFEKGNTLKILALGDVVGKDAVTYISANLRNFKRVSKIDFTVINAENSAAGNGIDEASA